MSEWLAKRARGSRKKKQNVNVKKIERKKEREREREIWGFNGLVGHEDAAARDDERAQGYALR